MANSIAKRQVTQIGDTNWRMSLCLKGQPLFNSSWILAFKNVGFVSPEILYFKRRQKYFFPMKYSDLKFLTPTLKLTILWSPAKHMFYTFYSPPVYKHLCRKWGFPGGSVGKEFTCNAGNVGRHKFNPQVRMIPWRRAWQPTPVFLPGESHGQRILAGYSPLGCKESDMTEATEHAHTCRKWFSIRYDPVGGNMGQLCIKISMRGFFN